jgi:hypothetical protein
VLMRKCAAAITIVGVVLLMPGAASPAGRSCRSFQPPPTKVVHRAPPADLVSRMAVLRRPQQPGDLPDHDLTSGGFLHLLAIDYVRKLGTGRHGETYYLVPGSVSVLIPPRRCLRGLSPHVRRVQARIRRQEIKRSRTIGLGTFEFGPALGGGGGGFADAHALLHNRTIFTSGNPHGATVSALVPDGVASVTLRWHRGPERNVTVANNFWLTTVPRSAPRAFPHSTIWRDAAGHLVRSFREPGGR